MPYKDDPFAEAFKDRPIGEEKESPVKRTGYDDDPFAEEFGQPAIPIQPKPIQEPTPEEDPFEEEFKPERSLRNTIKSNVRAVAGVGSFPLHYGVDLAATARPEASDLDIPIAQAETDYEMVPGMVHTAVTRQVDAKFKVNEWAETKHHQIDKEIGEIVDGTVDFVLDIIPSVFSDDWRPKRLIGMESPAEQQAQQQAAGESAVGKVFATVGLVPTMIKDAVTNATGSRFLGQQAEVAAYPAVIKGMHFVGKRGIKDLREGYAKAREKAVSETGQTGTFEGEAPAEMPQEVREQVEVAIEQAKEKQEIAEKTQGVIETERFTTESGGEKITYETEEGDTFSVLKNKGMPDKDHAAHVEMVANRVREERAAIRETGQREQAAKGKKRAVTERLAAKEIPPQSSEVAPGSTISPEKGPPTGVGVEPFSEASAPPPPPTRIPSGSPVKGMASGRFRFNRGKLFDPEGRKIGEGYSRKEGIRVAQEMNERHNLTGQETLTNKKLKQVDFSIINPKIDFRKAMDWAIKNGFTPTEILNRIRHTYYNLSEPKRAAFKGRYQDMVMHANALKEKYANRVDEYGRKPFSPEKPILPKPAATKETTARAVAPETKQTVILDQRLEERPSRAKEPAPPKEKKSKKEKAPPAEKKEKEPKQSYADWKKRYDQVERVKGTGAHIRRDKFENKYELVAPDGSVLDIAEQGDAAGLARLKEGLNPFKENAPKKGDVRTLKNGSSQVFNGRRWKWVSKDKVPNTVEKAKVDVKEGKAPKRQEPKPKAQEKPASEVTDPELEAMARDVFGDGQPAEFVDHITEGGDLLPFPNEDGVFPNGEKMNAALLTPEGQVIVGRGSGAGHKLIMDYIPKEDQGFYAKNKATHVGMADRNGRFISLKELGDAKADYREAYTNKYGPERIDLKDRKPGSDQPAFGSEQDAIESLQKQNWDTKAEWDWEAQIGETHLRITKRKGRSEVGIEIDGHVIRGSKSKKIIDALIRNLNNEGGHAFMFNDLAHRALRHEKILRTMEDAAAEEARVLGQDLKHEATLFTRWAGEAGRRGKQLVAPHLADRPGTPRVAKMTGEIISHRNAQFDMAKEQLALTYRKLSKAMEKLSDAQNTEFIDAMEHGDWARIEVMFPNAPKFMELVRKLRESYGMKWGEVQKVGGIETLIENHFPRYWKARNTVPEGKLTGRRPLLGQRTFFRGRKYKYFKDGLAAGEIPISYNPIEHFLWKMGEMDKYLTGKAIFEELKARGIAKYQSVKNEIPTGWEKLDDPIGSDRYYDKMKKAWVERGVWIVPTEAARVFNNYLRPGYYSEGSLWYNTMRSTNMTLNMAQLGFSLFHFTFTGMDAITSNLSLAVEEAGRGQGLSAIRRTAETLTPVAGQAYTIGKTLKHGSDLIRDIHNNPMMAHIRRINPQRAAMIDAITKGGGGIALDKYYRINARARLKTAWKERRYMSSGVLTAMSVVEGVAWPIMEWWVPRMKLGIFYEQANSIMKYWEKNGIKPTLELEREVYQRIWNSVDNRMGQLRYDNLHLNKKFKDILILSQRAAGWNIGTWREIGGGAVELVTHTLGKELLGDSASRALRRKRGLGVLSTKSAYLVSTFAMLWYTSGMLQRFMSGLWPGEDENGNFSMDLLWADLHYPRTGRKKPDGSWQRIQIPSYVKDVKHYLKDPIGTIAGKASPLLGVASDIVENRDFEGRYIWDPDAKWTDGVKGVGRYFGRQFIPFSQRNVDRIPPDADWIQQSLIRSGALVPAPSSAGRGPGLNKAKDINYRKFSGVPKDEESDDKSRARDKLYTAWRNQDINMYREAVKEGRFTPDQINRMKERFNRSPLVNAIERLTPKELVVVFEECDPAEKKEIAQIVVEKIRNSTSIDDAKKVEYLDEIGRLWREAFPSNKPADGGGGIRG